MPQEPRICLWLLPQPVDVLRQLICELAQTHGTPQFAPHLTLLGGLRMPRLALADTAARLAATSPPLTLEPLSINGEPDRFRCLYVRLALTGGLARIRHRAETLMRQPGTAFLPHLSLYYGNMNVTERTRLAQELMIRLPATITVDRLALVDTSGEVEDWNEVAAFALSS
ncbi:MAG: hypothetical protein M0Z84_12555 [Gammaproteobacteria bacterium]|nr:hypothetical protein [Gammaproteobacteria bacterium]